MRTFVLISCVKKKLGHRAKARELYTSTWFKLAYQYATSLGPDGIFILSAKVGLLDPDTEIEPYEKTLNTMPAAEVKAWAELVVRQLMGRVGRANLTSDHFIVLASERYRKHILCHLGSPEVPMRDLRIGEQLHWLKKHVGQ